MKSKSSQLLIILFYFMLQSAYCQLTGYYTIGGSGANYQTLPAAISDLYQQGVNGNVTFALNPGTYPGVTFTEIPGASADNRFVLQSATLDSTDVVIESTVYFDESSYISIIALTISTDEFHTIDFFRSKHIFIKNCVLNSDYPTYYSDGSIKISHFWPDQGDYSHITFDHCAIFSNTQSIYCKGYNGYTTFNYCEVNSGLDVAMEAKWCKRININNCTLNGGLDMYWTSNSNLRNNFISGEMDVQSMDSLLNNTFISNDVLWISAKYFKGNHFSGLQLSCSNGYIKFVDNYSEVPISIGHATNIQMTGNIFLDKISLGFNQVLLFENNILYGDLHYGDTYTGYWNYKINNNIFFNGCLIGRGHHSIINYNNFVDSAYLYVEYTDISVHDNNFCRGIEGGTLPENISHNNYYPLIYCYYDTNSTHYDPIYLESNPGIATNPMLQGKGWSEAPETDFSGNLRKNPPAVGANEIYVCSDSMNNLINVPCGDELYLNMCSLQDTGNYWWTPDTCIMYPDSSYTAVTACDDMTWYLNNSIYGIIDSVSIQVEPFEVEIAEMPLFYCGYARTLNASYHPSANYHWTPETGLTNPYIRNPKLLIEDTNNLQYVLECQIDGCGTSYDTLSIDYDPLPNVGIYFPTQNADTIFFTCTSTCVDEYLWDFGDGTFSAEENPYHVFEVNGIYTVTLTGTNSFGSRSHTVNYYFYYDFDDYWAPVGATWYYEIVYPFSSMLSYIKYESVGTTFILNKECKIITATGGETAYGHLVGNSDTAYTYENNGKIFVFDPYNNDFSLIYDFSADSGTIWNTTWDTCNFERSILEVDSIDVNGNYLKLLSHGAYNIIERIGGERTLFHGLGIVDCNAIDTIIYDEPFVQRLRCYEDDIIGFYETGISSTCDFTLGIESSNQLSDHVIIYPNPANDKVYVEGLPDKGRIGISISSLSGIDLIIADFRSKAGTIDISGLKPGIYLIRIKLESNVITRKIIVLH